MPAAHANTPGAAAPGLAEIHWSPDPRDRDALTQRHDWSALTGLEQLWPELERLHGDAIALEAPHARPPETLSFAALRRRVDQAAAGFAALGLRAGEVVALFAENSPRWLVADQGLMRVGAADAVRGSGAPAEELRFILGDCGAVGLVLESAALLERLELPAEALAPLRFVVLLEGAAPETGWSGPPLLSWDALLERGAAANPPPAPAADPEIGRAHV